jgi:integrase
MKTMPVIKLTQGVVDKLACDEALKQDYFDSCSKGLMVQVRPSGRKTFYLRERNEQGKTCQVKIGDAEFLKLNTVRKLVEERRAARSLWRLAGFSQPIGSRGNPPTTANVEPAPIEDTVTTPTIEAFVRESYLPFIRTYKRSYDSDLSLINNHVIPFFGDKQLHELTKQDLIAFITARRPTHKPGTINRVIILMRYVYNLALKWETPGLEKNVVKGTPLLEENNKRERYLSSEEVDRLVYCVRRSRNPMLQYIIPGLILTGARKQELLRARWEDLNFDTKIWRIPMSKSGKARHVPISDSLKLLLDSIPQTCEWVFANPKTLKPFVGFYYSWDTARKQAGLDEVRVHDLRHSFASFLVNNGRSLYEVQRILGHTQIKTTQRYAHLDQSSLLSAVNEISKAAPNVLGAGTRPPLECGRAFQVRKAERAKPRKDSAAEAELVAWAESLRKGG